MYGLIMTARLIYRMHSRLRTERLQLYYVIFHGGDQLCLYIFAFIYRHRYNCLIGKIMGGEAMQSILIVEDDTMMNSGLCYNLQLDKYKVVSAKNATEAIEHVKSDNFDLAVLDINLPDRNGFDLCKKLKSVHEIPVIFLTARDLESDMMTGFEPGADDYITKPFSVNIFRKKVSAS